MRAPRRGYAMVMVLVFMALLLSIYGVAYREVAATLRIETARVLLRQRDEGSLPALARGLALLETGPLPQDPYVCSVSIDTPTGPPHWSRVTCWFTVTFASEMGTNNWSVHVAPTELQENPLMPATFAP